MIITTKTYATNWHLVAAAANLISAMVLCCFFPTDVKRRNTQYIVNKTHPAVNNTDIDGYGSSFSDTIPACLINKNLKRVYRVIFSPQKRVLTPRIRMS